MKSSFLRHRLAIITVLLCVALSAEGLSQQGAPVSERTVEFLVIGDWGTGGTGAKRVSKAMTEVYRKHGATAIISTGDNFYPSGVSDVHDPQWQGTFEKIYPAGDLPVPFWAVLGNHDYRKNPDAQVDYSGRTLADGTITRWRMPARAWSTAFTSTDGTLSVRLVGIDTQQLIGDAAKRKAHLEWIDSTLAAAKEQWLLLVGHHPVYAHGHYGDNAALKKHLAPLMIRHGAHAYFNGHEHDLQVIHQVGGVRYLISGAGSSHRKTSPGARTEFCAATMGFMRIVCEKETMQIELYDSAAKLLFSAADKRDRKKAK